MIFLWLARLGYPCVQHYTVYEQGCTLGQRRPGNAVYRLRAVDRLYSTGPFRQRFTPQGGKGCGQAFLSLPIFVLLGYSTTIIKSPPKDVSFPQKR